MGIEYVFVDTCVLAGILLQYNPVAPHDKLVESPFLKQDMLKLLNKIIEDRLSDSGYVIASIFAFVELINKMKSIFGEKLSLERINSVISQPPSWLIIEPMDVQTANFFCDVPDMVMVKMFLRMMLYMSPQLCKEVINSLSSLLIIY